MTTETDTSHTIDMVHIVHTCTLTIWSTRIDYPRHFILESVAVRYGVVLRVRPCPHECGDCADGRAWGPYIRLLVGVAPQQNALWYQFALVFFFTDPKYLYGVTMTNEHTGVFKTRRRQIHPSFVFGFPWT